MAYWLKKANLNFRKAYIISRNVKKVHISRLLTNCYY